MHIHPVFYFTISYFIIGALVIALLPRRNSGTRPWLKFITYFLIVHIIIISVLVSKYLFMAIACLIVLLGAMELLKLAAPTQNKINTRTILQLVIYILLSIGFILFSSLSANQILYVYFLVITFDGFSQLMGQWLGKHKLTPVISPNKTVEGFVGGLLCCVFTSYFIRDWINITAIKSILIGLGIVVIALSGDLAASWYKRQKLAKDFGTIIPGHGGVLDRFDSLIPVGCFYYLAVKFLGL